MSVPVKQPDAISNDDDFWSKPGLRFRATSNADLSATPFEFAGASYNFFRGVYVGGAGNVDLVPIGGGSAVTFTAVPAGTILPVMAQQVAGSSTATGIVEIF